MVGGHRADSTLLAHYVAAEVVLSTKLPSARVVVYALVREGVRQLGRAKLAPERIPFPALHQPYESA
eukprot:SAG31_NODE_2158_length_6304_cov_2.589525_1_plen_67_part_00